MTINLSNSGHHEVMVGSAMAVSVLLAAMSAQIIDSPHVVMAPRAGKPPD